jgi:hypothetical protein
MDPLMPKSSARPSQGGPRRHHVIHQNDHLITRQLMTAHKCVNRQSAPGFTVKFSLTSEVATPAKGVNHRAVKPVR